MQFLYHHFAGKTSLSLEKKDFLHLKARRIKTDDKLVLRNLKDDLAFTYLVSEISKYTYELKLIKSEQNATKKSDFCLALAVIEPKILEKTLPFLNELNLSKLILVYSDFSQKNFKIDLQRFERILIQSCQQCGRTNLMQIELFKNTKALIENYKNIVLLDFQGQNFQKENLKNKLLFIGPEGGFSAKEREIINQKIKLDCPNILKTQTASIALVAKFLI